MKNDIEKYVKECRTRYGDVDQVLKVIEELSELQRAIARYLIEPKPKRKKAEILDEVADVWLMLEQLSDIMGFDFEDIIDRIDYKIDRQRRRWNDD